MCSTLCRPALRRYATWFLSVVGAAAKHSFAWTATVFVAETLASRGDGAAHHGARLLLSTAVFVAMCRSTLCVGGASCKFAGSARTMLDTDTTCLRTSGAAFLFAHFLAAAAVFAAPASWCCGGSGARVQGAVSKGAMLDADELAKDLRGVAVCLGAGRLHRVLEAQATFLLRGGGATFSKTLAVRAVFSAQSTCFRLGGAAIDRAGLLAVTNAESSSMDCVGATIHRAHLLFLAPSPLLFLISQQL